MPMTRRELIKAAGIAGVALGSPGVIVAASDRPSDDGPGAFLTWAYQQRAQAVTAGRAAQLDRIYDPANVALNAYERDRAGFLRTSKIRWPGEMLWNASSVYLLALESTASTARARLYERFETRWRPAEGPMPHPAGELRLAPRLGPDRATSSIAVIKHEVELSRGASGWRIARDQHDEFDLFGRSPDLVQGSWAVERYGRTSGDPAIPPDVLRRASGTKGPGLARPRPSHLYYSRAEAVGYAQTYASSPNTAYCNYDTCDTPGDCTNFVSQCLRDGGHPDSGSWRTFDGSCWGTNCSPSDSTQAGDTIWIRVLDIWTFLISTTGRAQSVGSIDSLASGDLVQYDWDQGGANPFMHSALTSVWIGGVARVCCRTPSRTDYHWQLDDTTADWRFGSMYTNFHQ